MHSMLPSAFPEAKLGGHISIVEIVRKAMVYDKTTKASCCDPKKVPQGQHHVFVPCRAGTKPSSLWLPWIALANQQHIIYDNLP